MGNTKFVRFGSLSSVNHKAFYKSDSFHSPPVKNGLYAFIYPYIEDFLWVWKVGLDDKVKQYRKNNRKVFEYTGELWVHWVDVVKRLGYGLDTKKSWVKIHTDCLDECFRVVKLLDRRELGKYEGTMVEVQNCILDPYKRGLGGRMSRDHLEVFIEHVK